MKRVSALSLFLLIASAGVSAAQDLVADLSSPVIEITTGFAGADVLLFGTYSEKGEVVVVVRGPMRREIVRKKERIIGIWVNRDVQEFAAVPTYYRVAGTSRIADIAPKKMLERHQIGVDSMELPLLGPVPGSVAREFRAALIRNKIRANLFGGEEGTVKIVGGKLFRTTLHFPANVPTGVYPVEVYLFRDGNLLKVDTHHLTVRKVGLEATIFNVAHSYPAIYGAFAIIVALVAGWLAGVIFRQR